MLGEFLGHGVLAWQLQAGWPEMMAQASGMSVETATKLLPIIGCIDIAIALLAVVKPIRIVLVWAAIWGLVTALARPLAGQVIWAFVERLPNVAIPVALLFVRGLPRRARDWIS